MKHMLAFKAAFSPEYSVTRMEDEAAQHRLRPARSGSAKTIGFVEMEPLVEGETGCMTWQQDGAVGLLVEIHERHVKSKAFQDCVARDLERHEAEHGRFENPVARQRVKNDIVDRYLTHALTKVTRVPVLLDGLHRRAVLGTTSADHARSVVDFVNHSVPGVRVTSRERPAVNLRDSMTQWVSVSQSLPAEWELGQEAVIKSNEGAVVRVRQHHLGAEEIVRHLHAGKKVCELALVRPDLWTLRLDSTMAIKRFEPHAAEAANDDDREDEERDEFSFATFRFALSVAREVFDTLTRLRVTPLIAGNKENAPC